MDLSCPSEPAPSTELSTPSLQLTGEWRICGGEGSSWGNTREIHLTSELDTDQRTLILSPPHTHRHVNAHVFMGHTLNTLSSSNQSLDSECANDVVDINEEGDALLKAANDANHRDITLIPGNKPSCQWMSHRLTWMCVVRRVEYNWFRVF